MKAEPPCGGHQLAGPGHAVPGAAFGVDHDADYEPAGALLAAVFDGCEPCTRRRKREVLDGDRLLIVDLASSVFIHLPVLDEDVSATTKTFHPLARGIRETRDGLALYKAVAALSSDGLEDLLTDALRYHIRAEEGLSGFDVPDAPAAPGTAPRRGLVDDIPALYGLGIGRIPTSQGELPMLALMPENPAAGLEHLRDRCQWPAFDMREVPPVDTRWQVIIDQATRTLLSVMRVYDDGLPEIPLWDTNEIDPLPDTWFALAERQGRVLLCGPQPRDDLSPGQARQAAAQGRMRGIVALAVVQPALL
jgi:hypothetical protein